MSSQIHPTAIIDPSVKIADGVTVGAYSIIGADVEIGENTSIGPHVTITGPTTIGHDNRFYQFSSIGEDPQDKKYAGEPTRLEIGNGNTIREFCTFNRGTVQDGGVTRLGDDNWIMAYVHIAHDCHIGSHTVFANNASLAGHVAVGDYAILGGYAKVHQFCKVGAHSFCGFDSGLNQDVPPYFTVVGSPAHPKGINAEGLRRRGFTVDGIRAIKDAYRDLYRRGLRLEDAKASITEKAKTAEELIILRDFLNASDRGIVR